MDSPASDSPTSDRDPAGETSFHVHRARRGDSESLAWLVTRLSPLLLAQAEYRLGPRLRAFQEPADLVSEVWLVALPRLAELEVGEGRETPVLLRFLSTTLLNHLNNLARKLARRQALLPEEDPVGGPSNPSPVERAKAQVTGVVTRVCRRELAERVTACLAELSPQDREIIVLRGVEQSSNEKVAGLLGIRPKAASERYRRALKRLRRHLPNSVFDELPAG